jgi:hypothetical protein
LLWNTCGSIRSELSGHGLTHSKPKTLGYYHYHYCCYHCQRVLLKQCPSLDSHKHCMRVFFPHTFANTGYYHSFYYFIVCQLDVPNHCFNFTTLIPSDDYFCIIIGISLFFCEYTFMTLLFQVDWSSFS